MIDPLTKRALTAYLAQLREEVAELEARLAEGEAPPAAVEPPHEPRAAPLDMAEACACGHPRGDHVGDHGEGKCAGGGEDGADPTACECEEFVPPPGGTDRIVGVWPNELPR